MYNYSIIIPHKNIPDLLQRCLDSIPKQDNIQIIVVDDNSDPSIVDFNHFPGIQDPHVEIYFTKDGKGAGYARNVGMKYAKGEWILFADADDMFLDNVELFLDKCVDLDYDVVIFNYISKRLNGDYKNINHIETTNYREVFLKKCFPWCKLIKKSLLVSHNIKFQEVLWSNDLMFAVQLAKYSQNVKIDEERVYMQIERYESLCKKVTWQSLYCRTKVALQAYDYLRLTPESKYMRYHYMDYWKELFHIKKTVAVFMIPRICNVVGLKNAYDDIMERLKIDYPKFFN